MGAPSSGTGVRNASELTAADVSVIMTGAGAAWVTATDSVDGNITSSAVLNVFGDPESRSVTADEASEVIYY